MNKSFEQILTEQTNELTLTDHQKAQIEKLSESGWEVSNYDKDGNPVVVKESSAYKFIVRQDGTFEAVENGE